MKKKNNNVLPAYLYLTAPNSNIQSEVIIVKNLKTFVEFKMPDSMVHRVYRKNPVLLGYKVKLFNNGERLI